VKGILYMMLLATNFMEQHTSWETYTRTS